MVLPLVTAGVPCLKNQYHTGNHCFGFIWKYDWLGNKTKNVSTNERGKERQPKILSLMVAFYYFHCNLLGILQSTRHL